MNKFDIKLIPQLKIVLLQTEQFETSRSYALIITHNAKHNLLSMHMLEHNYSIYYQAYTAYIL